MAESFDETQAFVPTQAENDVRTAVQEWMARQRQIRLRLSVAAAFCALLAIVLGYGLQPQSKAHYQLTEVIAMVLMLAVPLFCVILSVQSRVSLWRLQAAYPAELSAGNAADCRKQRRKTNYQQLGILCAGVIGSILMRGALLFLVSFVLAVIVVSRNNQLSQMAAPTLRDILEREERKRRQEIGCGACVLMAVGFGALLLTVMLDFVASARVKALEAGARAIYEIAEDWQEIDGNVLPAVTILKLGDTGEDGSLSTYISTKYVTQGECWCAVLCNDDGTLAYTLFSKRTLTEDCLEKMSLEEQRALEASLFRRGEAVAYYTKEKEQTGTR